MRLSSARSKKHKESGALTLCLYMATQHHGQAERLLVQSCEVLCARRNQPGSSTGSIVFNTNLYLWLEFVCWLCPAPCSRRADCSDAPDRPELFTLPSGRSGKGGKRLILFPAAAPQPASAPSASAQNLPEVMRWPGHRPHPNQGQGARRPTPSASASTVPCSMSCTGWHFRKTIYRTSDELQADLDAWLVEYNGRRSHQGRWCFGKTPMQTGARSLPRGLTRGASTTSPTMPLGEPGHRPRHGELRGQRHSPLVAGDGTRALSKDHAACGYRRLRRQQRRAGPLYQRLRGGRPGRGRIACPHPGLRVGNNFTPARSATPPAPSTIGFTGDRLPTKSRYCVIAST